MKARLLLLAIAVAALAAGAAWVTGGLDGKPDEIRMAVAWGLPATLFLAARFTVGRLPAKLGWSSLLAALPWIGAALALDLAPIGLAYALDWLTLTYGDQALAASRATTALWALPLLVVVAVRFSEATLRDALYERSRGSFGEPVAWTLSIACGALLVLPVVAPGGEPLETPFLAAAAVTALARQVVAIALYRRSGLVACGLHAGFLAFFDAYGLGDWISPLFPSANYVSSTDAFYALRAAGPLAAAALLVAVLRRTSGPPAPPAPPVP